MAYEEPLVDANHRGFSVYSDWRISRWDSPLSDLESVALVSLIDDGTLRITLEAPREPDRHCWCVTFERPPGYRNLLEEYRLDLWTHLDTSKQRCGNTFVVDNSPWTAHLRQHEGIFDTHFPHVHHFVILTEDDVIEVLSDSYPLIEDLGATHPDAPAAGKSTVLHNPEDRAQTEERFSRLKRKQSER